MFPTVGPQHAGVYKSVIANKLGKAACYAHLYVTGEAGTLPVSCVHSLASGPPRGLGEGRASTPAPSPSVPRGSRLALPLPPVAVPPAPSPLPGGLVILRGH